MLLCKGDIILLSGASGSEGKLSRIIKRSSQRKGESETRYSHVGIITTGGLLVDGNEHGCKITEMTYPKMRTVDLLKYEGCQTSIYRARSVDHISMGMMVQELHKRVGEGRKYGWFNILLHGADSGLNYLIEKIPKVKSDIRPFTRLFFQKNAICSSLVAELFNTYFSIWFGKAPRLIQPDGIDDHCAANPKSFELIFEGEIK